MTRTVRRALANRTSLAIGLAAFVATSMGWMSLSAAGDGARAQALANHNSNAPISYAADHFDLQDRADRASFWGNVRVEQAGLVMTAERLTVAYSRGGGTEINRIDVSGGVTVTKGDESARGSVAVYDLDQRIITLVGGVQLRQGANTMSGGRLVIDLNSGRVSMDGRGGARDATGAPVSGTGGSGRVSGSFSVPKRN
jgi:lipopolysaccharide export system protein LptA